MAYTISLAVEVIGREEMLVVLDKISEALEEHRRSTRKFKVKSEVKGIRGKSGMHEEVTFEPGEVIDLTAFGLPTLLLLEQLLEETETARKSTPVHAATLRLARDAEVSITAGGQSVTIPPRR